MASCTLDDLVPRIRCNKITLEPVRNVGTDNSVDYGVYEVHIDASVYDYIDQHDGGSLSNYLLSDTFRKNVNFYGVFSRDTLVKDFVDFLRANQSSTFTAQGSPSIRGMKPAQAAYLFKGVLWTVGEVLEDAAFRNWFYDNKNAFLEVLRAQSNSSLVSTSVNPVTSALGHLLGIQSGASYYASVRDEILQLFSKMPIDSASFSPSDSFIGRTIRHALLMIFSDAEFTSFRFDQVLTQEVLNYNSGILQTASGESQLGVRTLDPDGNVYYDFKIGTTSGAGIPAYENSVNVSECYYHSISYLDMEQNLLDKGIVLPSGGIPLQYDTIEFFYNNIDQCSILSNKLPASGIVQDFRISERIQEIIRSDRINMYDNAIDQISLISSEVALNEDGLPLRENGLTSQLFSSYIFEPGIYKVFTRNYFYFDILKFLRRKSNLSFLYESFSELSTLGASLESGTAPTINIEHTIPTDVIAPYLQIPTMNIYRVRRDEKEDRKLIKTKADLLEIGLPIGTNGYSQLYKFVDQGFSDLTDGEYSYQIEMIVKDPIVDTVRFYTSFLKHMISTLKQCIEYIHNNAAEYNELRDELSDGAKDYILGLIDTPSFKSSHVTFEILFRMFTGYSLYQIQVTDLLNSIDFNMDLWMEFSDHYSNTGEYDWSLFPINTSDYDIGSWLTDRSKLNRRAIENLHRIAQDLEFGISKFVNTSTIAEYGSSGTASNVGVKKASELLDYSRTWRQTTVKAALDYRTMLTLPSTQQEEYDSSQFGNQYSNEFLKHVSNGSQIPAPMLQKMNFLTPSRVGRHAVIFNRFSGIIGDATQTYIKVIDATLRKPDVMESEANAGIYAFAGGGYEGGVENLKNDSGVFETTLFEYGVTVKNLNASAINTNIELDLSPLRPTYGIDFGRNEPTDKSEIVEANQQQLEEAMEQLQADRSAVINSLFAEKIKKEDLVMNILVDKGAHHILDRRKIVTQSGDNEHKFEGFNILEFHSMLINGTKPYPKLLNPLLIGYYSLANESTHIIHAMRIMASRFIVDNTFLVFYLDSLDDDLNPVWRELDASLLGTTSLSNAGTNTTKILCKLERFRMRGTDMSVGHGATSELEITNKYFYLNV